MTDQNFQTTPHRDSHSSEVQSTIRLIDFFSVWYRYRWVYLVGLLAVGAVTFVYVRYVAKKFYLAETRFVVYERYQAATRPGLAEAGLYGATQNEQFMTVVMGVIAEQFLLSTDVLMGAADKLAQSPPDEGQAVDIPEMIAGEMDDRVIQRQTAMRILRDDLVRYRVIQNSGVAVFSVELPDQYAVSRYVNACMEELRRHLEDFVFGEVRAAHGAYENQHRVEMELRERLAEEIKSISEFDVNPVVRERYQALQAELAHQAGKMAEIAFRRRALDFFLSSSKQGANPVLKIIEPAQVPIKKSRPKTVITTVMAAALYSFVFMMALVVLGYLNWARGDTRASDSIA